MNLEAGPGRTVVELSGGVSCTVLAVTEGDRRWIVKKSLARLKVADEWLAKRERILTEARALQVAARLAPGSVPAVLDVDENDLTIAIEAAPESWENWKTRLLRGDVDSSVAAVLGTALAAVHRGTSEDGVVKDEFDDVEAFEQLRVDPYYRTIAERVPDVRNPVHALIERMLATKACLVHGDFSPKNVLTAGGAETWILDWEVAHTGDPAFDLAFLTNHLVLKSINAPAFAAAYRGASDAFTRAYGDVGDEAHAVTHLGALLVARTDGKSPAEYLTNEGRARARALGTSILRDRPATFAEVWSEVA